MHTIPSFFLFRHLGRGLLLGLIKAMAIAVAIALLSPILLAQQTLLPADDTRDYRDAKQWFAEGNYALSYPVFKRMEHQLGQRVPMPYELAMDEIRFFSIACELQLENASAENNARHYLKTVQSEGLRASMSVHLGRYYFRKENHAAAAEAFAQTNPDNLSPNDKDAWMFEYGYSLFTQRKLKEAKPLLDEVRRNASSRYYTDGNYYYGLLAYADGQYKEALACFDIAALNVKYQPLTPYYNASIQYALGNKDKGLELAEKALKSGNSLYNTELNQLVGHAWFEKGNYAKALPYLEKYVNSSAKVKREDLYELASCYYHQKQYAKAIEGFRPLSSGQDSLTQHAMYLLGDAYLQTNDKANARTAFIFCAGNSSNATIRESSIFHVGKLAHDLGLDNEAIIALKQYLAAYPGGRFKAEGQDLLVAALA
ncbi:MAG: tetratricopeptide repeat protein, partial [Chitinophagaceae bacterium]|nr:tetratricopeptide repeat protein [Chitinophagaceae bacterium]